jgi:hypothetical protein
MNRGDLKAQAGKDTGAYHVGYDDVGRGEPGDFLLSHAVVASYCHLLVEALLAGKAKRIDAKCLWD